MNWNPRLAQLDDISAIEQLIPQSVLALQAPYYSEAQMCAALGPVFGVDRQLIEDGTYYLVENDGRIIGCGGWSRRKSIFGGDQCRAGPDPELNPACAPARIRAFFVHQDWARRGIGRSILVACETAIRAANFRSVELVATLAGEPLYASHGYAAIEGYDINLNGGLQLPVVRMRKSIPPDPELYRSDPR